jgi:hypothetical protein
LKKEVDTMGKAKLRKQTRFNPRQKLPLGCFIANCRVSDAHAVYLGIGRGSEGYDHVQISAHKYVTKAYEILSHCNQVLKKFKPHLYQNSFDIRDAFTDALIARVGNYSSDDAKFRVTTSDPDPNLIDKWLEKGNILGIDKLPVGTSVEVIKPRVVKKWKIFRSQVKDYNRNNYGDPNENHQFYIAQADTLPPLLVKDLETGRIAIASPYSHYVYAAYIADFVNEQKKDFLTVKELTKLLNVATRLVERK